MGRQKAEDRLTIRSPAKINLSLRVLGRRDDGFHELRTVFQSIALHDTLTFVRRRGPFLLECTDPRVPVDERNLVARAARALWRARGRGGDPRDLRVRIVKRIPPAGGLGGASANAAAALMALSTLWRIRKADLRQIASEVGSDVAFFLSGGTALGLGRGDEIYPLADVPRMAIVLLVPDFGVTTADAYRWFDEAGRPPAPRAPIAIAGLGETDLAISNDLQESVSARHPQVAELVDALERAGARGAAMAGSGSTVFGIYTDEVQAARAARALRRIARVLVTRTLRRAEHQRMLGSRLAASRSIG